MRAVAQQVVALAQSDRTTVLIQGESGAGKAWIARLIHDLGARAREPFLEAWCSGADAVTLETRLFGAERGALPDTRRRVRGRLELASQGTLLLARGRLAAPRAAAGAAAHPGVAQRSGASAASAMCRPRRGSS